MMPRKVDTPRRRGIRKEISKSEWTCRRSPVGGISSLNVNKAAEQGEIERKINNIVFMCVLL